MKVIFFGLFVASLIALTLYLLLAVVVTMVYAVVYIASHFGWGLLILTLFTILNLLLYSLLCDNKTTLTTKN
jgi:hypothetical protein